MNIVRKPSLSAAHTFDAVRALRDMLGWDPFVAMSAPTFATQATSFTPDFEVKETKEGYLFRADLPGMKEKDLELSLTGNRLTVSGKREGETREEGEKYYVYERSFGAFTRSFTLPDGVEADKVKAELKEGVLTLLLPRRPEMQPKRISVST